MAIDNILDITAVKKGETVGFSYENPGTPSDPVLYVYDMDGNLIQGMIDPENETDEVFYFFYDTSDLTAQKHYLFIVDDVTPFSNEEFLVYITNELAYENEVIRSLGLAGHNLRLYSFTYTNGNLTSFKIRTYETKTALETAENGGTDDYIASYTVTISYDASYNKSYKTSIKD